MNLRDFTEGIKILATFYNDPDGYHIGAEHDIFYMYQTDKPIPADGVKKLVDHGWFQEDAEYAGSEYKETDYDSEEGWACFT